MKLWDKIHASGLVIERYEFPDDVVLGDPYILRDDAFYNEWKASHPDPIPEEPTQEELQQEIDEKNALIESLQSEVSVLENTLGVIRVGGGGVIEEVP